MSEDEPTEIEILLGLDKLPEPNTEEFRKIQNSVRQYIYRINNIDKHNKRSKDYYHKNKIRDKDKLSKFNKKSRIKYKYNLSLDQVKELYIYQNFKCFICEEPRQIHELSIDHCHDTKLVRGLLCNNCNVGVGYLQDSVRLFTNAILYINAPPAQKIMKGIKAK